MEPKTELKAKQTKCIECGAIFNIPVGEQKFIASMGWTTLPKRCRPCREIRRAKGVVKSPEVPDAEE